MKRRFTAAVVTTFVICTLILVSLIAVPVAAVSYPFQATDPEVAGALDYLRAQQDTDGSISDFSTSAWVVMAIAAAGEDPHDWKVGGNPSIVDYLASNAGSATSVTDYARMLLAIAAANEDPASFGGMDFVSLLESAHDGTQIGDGSLLNDDFWGVLGLIAAGRSPTSEVIANSVAFILSNQNTDGGWSWGVGQESDVDDTAAAIMTLIAGGESQSSSVITDALAYIKSAQMANGGFESWGTTNSATDAWGIDSIVAGGDDPASADWTSGDGYSPVDDLLSLQNEDGSFNWQSGEASNKTLMTAYAIPALLGEPYPAVVLESTPQEGIAIAVRIEGKNSTVWSGTVAVSESAIVDDEGGEHYLPNPTALGALDEASQVGDFPYVVKDSSFGLYIYSVNGEEPEGMNGWMYRVDYYSPAVGAADFILGETTPPNPPHLEVLFYYGEWGQLPLKIEVDKTEVDVGEQFTAIVTQYSDETNSWSPCEGATVHADQDYITGADGTVDITIDTDMTLYIYAGKEGFIRSNKVAVKVGTGTGTNKEVRLKANIIPAISFTVSPSSIDFGELGPGDTSSPRTITVTNTGTWTLLVTCSVTDEAEDLYVDGLKLDGKRWGLFSTTVNKNNSRETSATLTVPEDYTELGEQNGTIIFWAEVAP
jgi:hypothetical protein